jgi:hypothetical protein
MKHSIFVTGALLLAAVLSPLGAAEISASAGMSNFAFTDSGNIQPLTMHYGTAVSFRDQLMNNLDGIVGFECSPVNGNLLSARASWTTSILEISAGPSFGMLNSSSGAKEVPTLFQPGLGIGFGVTIPGIVTVNADTDFALPPASGAAGQVYLQKSKLSVGFFLPNTICTLGINQESNSRNSLVEPRIKSITDYGLYTEAYRKGAPWRIGVDFIYRVSDYYLGEDADENRKIGNLVLGGALTWSPKSDFAVFVSGDGSLYSFSLTSDKVDNLDKLLFDLKAGVKITTGKITAAR